MLTPQTPPARPRLGAPLIAAVALVVVVAGLLVWAVVGLLSADAAVDRAEQHEADAKERLQEPGAGGDAAFVAARDDADDAARGAVATVNTLDYRTVDADLDEWASVTTGALHDEVVGSRDQTRQTIANARSVTEATVLSTAVKELDERAGTATVLVAVKVNVQLNGAEPADKYQRISSTLRRTSDGWKLDGIAQVPYS